MIAAVAAARRIAVKEIGFDAIEIADRDWTAIEIMGNFFEGIEPGQRGNIDAPQLAVNGDSRLGFQQTRIWPKIDESIARQSNGFAEKYLPGEEMVIRQATL